MLTRHAAMESEAIAGFYEQLAAWLPRIVYLPVAIKIAAGIFSSERGPRESVTVNPKTSSAYSTPKWMLPT